MNNIYDVFSDDLLLRLNRDDVCVIREALGKYLKGCIEDEKEVVREVISNVERGIKESHAMGIALGKTSCF